VRQRDILVNRQPVGGKGRFGDRGSAGPRDSRRADPVVVINADAKAEHKSVINTMQAAHGRGCRALPSPSGPAAMTSAAARGPIPEYTLNDAAESPGVLADAVDRRVRAAAAGRLVRPAVRHATVAVPAGVLQVVRVPVPVLVVGNIAVAEAARRRRSNGWSAFSRSGLPAWNHQPGLWRLASRLSLSCPKTAIQHRSEDEPVLLARLARCGRDRRRSARSGARSAARPSECNVIVSDDGLQHYRLHRDLEIAVVDARILGNRWLLPAGPLRESVTRLDAVDLVLAHGALSDVIAERLARQAVFAMRLEGAEFVSVRNAGERRGVEMFRGRRVHAVAGIGRPERFFAQLTAMGLDVVGHPFPDHHRFAPGDLDFAPGEAKIITSKDAVKCASFAPADTWEFPVTARIAAGAAERILEKLTHGRQTA